MKLHKRLAGILTGLACISLLASCTPNAGGTHPVAITDAGNASNLFDPPVQNAAGWEVTTHEEVIPARILCRMSGVGNYLITTKSKPEDTSSITPDSATTLASLNPQDGSVRWARKITPEMRTNYVTSYTSAKSTTPQDSFLDFQECAGTSFVSNERYLAFYLRPWMASEGSSNISDQRMNIVVLDAETGNEVRTVEVSGLVLGQAIVNDSLVVETAQNYYPAGTGVINAFSLSKAQAEPTSFRSDQWLIGASPESLLMSQELPSRDSYDALWPYTITKVNTTGEELGTVIGVRALHPGGWVDRFKDPEAAAEIANSQGDASERTKALEALQHELFHVDTGTTLDAANLLVADVVLPTGSGILLYTQRTESEEEKTVIYPTPVSWLDTTNGRNSLSQEKTTQILHHASQHVWNDGFFPSLTTLTPGVEAPPGSLPLPKEQ